MDWLWLGFWVVWWSAVILILVYGAVLFFGAPYFPSLSVHVKAGLDLLDLKKGQTVYDLGCGDGRFLKAAAKRGLNAVGYELNPFMFLYSWITCLRYGRQVRVRWGNFWKADLRAADGVFVFLFTSYMEKFDELIKTNARKGVRVASHTFEIPGKKPIAKISTVFLYKY